MSSQAPRLHGRPGQLVVGGASRAAIGGAHFARRIVGSSLPHNRFEMAISPSVAMFVSRHLALGLAGDLEVQRAERQTAWGISIGPQALAYWPAGERFGFMPSFGAYYTHTAGDERVALSIKAAGAWHLSPGLSLTAGPQVTQDVWRQGARLRITDYDFVVGLVGWI